MRTTTELITRVERMESLENDLTAFLDNYTSTPFLLYPFLKNKMKNIPNDSSPLILVVKHSDEIIGLAPLLLKQRFGFREVTSLLKPTGSPDIISREEHREDALKSVLFVLLKKIRCKMVNLTLPAESKNLEILKQICRSSRISFLESTEQTMNHCIIPVNCPWIDYQKALSRKYRHTIKKKERRLSLLGEWKITFTLTTDDDQTADQTLDKIHEIEKNSWKEGWRLHSGNIKDQDLEAIWSASRILTRTNPEFRAMIWMLELNNEPVAYALAMCHKGTAILAKTSYVNEFGKLSPGFYIMNAALQDLFGQGDIQKIDFLTDLPFMANWHPLTFSRVKFKIIARNFSLGYYLFQKLRIRDIHSRFFA